MAAKKPVKSDGLKQLKTDLKGGALKSLYIFYGDEDFLREEYRNKIGRKLIPAGMEDFNYHRFQGKDLGLNTLTQAVEAMPMMNDRTLVEVWDWNLFQNKDRMEKLLELFSDLPEYVCLIFIYDTMKWSGNGNTKLGKFLKSSGALVEFAQQDQSDLNAWIRRRMRSKWDKEIDMSTAEYLTFLCGGLMTNLVSEMDKAGAYCKGGEVTKKDIDAVCDPILDAKVFQLTDAIGTGNYGRAMSLTEELIRMGEEPIPILAALGNQLRKMWSARLAMENRRGEGYLVELWELKGNQWQARKLMQNARSYSLKWCRRAVSLAQEADWKMKTNSSDREKETILLDFILALAIPEKEGTRRC